MLQAAFKHPKIKGKCLVPIVQHGTGAGILAYRLAGNVAKPGGIGTISSVIF